MNFYYVFTPNGISIEHNWNKVKAMIHKVPNSGCQRFDNKPNLEIWLEYVEKYCDSITINIFKNMINEQNENKKPIQLINESLHPKLKVNDRKGLRIIKKGSCN